jgi:mycothiol synthase
MLELQGSDGEPMSPAEWYHYRDRLLPNGLFLVEHLPQQQLVGTAGSLHNPNPGRYYFPFGGELGYVVVRPEHRRRGLGRALCAAAVSRLLSAGYESIRVCVQEHREAALRTYLRLGFKPFLHSAEVSDRWRRVCGTLEVPFTPDQWPEPGQ